MDGSCGGSCGGTRRMDATMMEGTSRVEGTRRMAATLRACQSGSRWIVWPPAAISRSKQFCGQRI